MVGTGPRMQQVGTVSSYAFAFPVPQAYYPDCVAFPALKLSGKSQLFIRILRTCHEGGQYLEIGTRHLILIKQNSDEDMPYSSHIDRTRSI